MDSTNGINKAHSPIELERPRAILVLGMHRSGTSALTRVISLLGADLPSDLIPPIATDNAKGYWESVDVCNLNEDILRAGRSFALDWRRFSPLKLDRKQYSSFHDRALQILKRDFSTSSLFVLKDPRFSRLLPFWLRVLEAFRVDASCVIAVRSPPEVSASLETRRVRTPAVATCGPAAAMVVWLRHCLDAERDSREVPRVFVHYASLLNDWRDEADKLSNACRIGGPGLSPRVAREIDCFLDTGLRHHWHETNCMHENPKKGSWIRSAYRAMLQLCEDPSSAAAKARLDKLKSQLDRANESVAVLWQE